MLTSTFYDYGLNQACIYNIAMTNMLHINIPWYESVLCLCSRNSKLYNIFTCNEARTQQNYWSVKKLRKEPSSPDLGEMNKKS